MVLLPSFAYASATAIFPKWHGSGMGSSRELGWHCSMQNGHQKDCSRGKEGQACTEPQTRHWVPCHVEDQFEGVRNCGPGVRFWGAGVIGS